MIRGTAAKKNNFRSDNMAYFLLLLPALTVVIILAVIPLISMIGASFFNWKLTSIDSPVYIGLDNFKNMFSDNRFIGSLFNQLVLSVGTVTSQIIMALIFSITFNALKGKLRSLQGVLLLPFVIPPVVAALAWLTIFTPTISPINAFLGLLGLGSPAWLSSAWGARFSIIIADTWNSFPFSAIILLSSLQGISQEIYEASDIDGATKAQKLFHLTLPLIRKSIIICCIFRLVDSLKSFPMIFIITGGGPGSATEVTNFYAYLQAFQYSNIGYASTIAFTVFIITIILSLLVGQLNKTSIE